MNNKNYPSLLLILILLITTNLNAKIPTESDDPNFTNFALNKSNPSRIMHSWIAFKINDKIYTNEDVLEYIEKTLFHTADNINVLELNKLAQQTSQTFESLKVQWLAKHFHYGLKKMAYLKIIENELFERNLEDAFYPSVTEVDLALRDFENSILGNYKDGITKARNDYGTTLRALGWPNLKNLSDSELYWSWREVQKQRITEQLRSEALELFTLTIAQENRKTPISNKEDAMWYIEQIRQSVDIIDVATSISENKNKINDLIRHEKDATKMILQISNDPFQKAVLKKIELISLYETPISVLYNNYPDKFTQINDRYLDEIYELLQSDIPDRIKELEAFFWKIVTDNYSREELRQLTQESNLSYRQTGNFMNFIMSKLYTLAQDIQALEKNRTNFSAEIMKTFARALEKARDNLSQEAIYLKDSYKDFTFDQILTEELKESSQLSQIDNIYIKAFLSIAFNIAKYYTINILKKDTAIPLISLLDGDEANLRSQIKNLLIQQKIKNSNRIFEEHLYTKYNCLIKVSPMPNEVYECDSAMKFLDIYSQ